MSIPILFDGLGCIASGFIGFPKSRVLSIKSAIIMFANLRIFANMTSAYKATSLCKVTSHYKVILLSNNGPLIILM